MKLMELDKIFKGDSNGKRHFWVRVFRKSKLLRSSWKRIRFIATHWKVFIETEADLVLKKICSENWP